MGADTTLDRIGRKPDRTRAWRWAVRAVKLVAVIFVLVHVYALALKWAPAQLP